jgi:hypothetical protein
MHSVKYHVVSPAQCRRKAGSRKKKGCVWTFYDECSLWMPIVIGNVNVKGD